MIYARTDHNTSICATRSTGAREPGTNGHQELIDAQAKYFEDNDQFLETLHNHYSAFPIHQVNIYDLARDRHADPHPKRALRIAAFAEMEADGAYTESVWLRDVTGKIKANEWAKPGKDPRFIGDLGVIASLEGAWITGILKDLQTYLRFIDGQRLRIVKQADTEVITEVFNEAIDPGTKYYGAFFSDDGLITVLDKHGVRRLFLTDISKCDKSHASIFRSLIRSAPTPLQEGTERVVKQLKKPLVVRSLVDRSIKVKLFLTTEDPLLLSGSTITTVVNNHAAINIYHQIILDGAETAEAIALAARKVGYILTVEEVPDVSKLQFLKHSPVRDVRGELHAVLNLGVFLRASGTCKGDLPGKSSDGLEKRARTFQRALLEGMYPRISNPFLDACKNATGVDVVPTCFSSIVAKELAHKTSTRKSHITVSNEELFRRYDLDACEALDLTDFSESGYSYFHNSPGLSKVLKLDYGLECCDRTGDLPTSFLWRR